jgi:CspA family cold shock protein
MEGRIVWFDAGRGYGFIEPADGGGDIVFGRAALATGLGGGDAVHYTVIAGENGPEATDVGPAVGPPGNGFAG